MESRPEKQHSEQMEIPSVTRISRHFSSRSSYCTLHCTAPPNRPPSSGILATRSLTTKITQIHPIIAFYNDSCILQLVKRDISNIQKKKKYLKFFFFSGILFANFGTLVANFPRVFNQKIRNFCYENHTHENLFYLISLKVGIVMVEIVADTINGQWGVFRFRFYR